MDDTIRRPRSVSTVVDSIPITTVTISGAFKSVIYHTFREALGDETYESLAGKGAAMTTSTMVAYAYGPNRPGASRAQGHRLNSVDVRGALRFGAENECWV